MKKLAPALFVSHGLPPMALLDDPYNSALIHFGSVLDIKGVVCVSSHWVVPGPVQITSCDTPFIQHNFSGFQKDLYDIQYQTPYSADLVEQVASLLDENNFEVILNEGHGFDNGVWMPMKLLRPEGDLPIVQVSLPLFEDPRKILELGHALSALREKGILLMGSGMAAMNAGKLVWFARGEDVQPKIRDFDHWLKENFLAADIESLLNYRSIAPNAEFSHPGTANLLPLFFMMGASKTGDVPQVLYEGFKYGATSLLSLCLSREKIEERPFS